MTSKKMITAIASVAMIQIVFAQQKPLTTKEDQQAKDYSQKIEMRNTNEIIAKYVKACKMTVFTTNSKDVVVDIEPLKTGRKDATGNEIYHINIMRNGKQVGYMVPDFEDYPVNMMYFNLERYKRSENGNHSAIACSQDMFILPTETFTMANNSFQSILFCDWKARMKDCRMMTYWNQRAVIAGEAKGAEERVAHNLADMRKYFMERYDAVQKYNERLLNYASTTSYATAMNEVMNKPEYFLFQRDGYLDSLKVTTEKDASGNVNKLIFHYPFFGKYVDNEKFKFTITKNTSGFFYINGAPNFMHFEGSLLVPFDGRLLIVNYQDYNKEYIPFQVISSTPFDALAMNILYSKKVYAAYSGTHPYRDDHVEYNEWYMKTFMETAVEYAKDNRNINVLLTSYITKLMLKK